MNKKVILILSGLSAIAIFIYLIQPLRYFNFLPYQIQDSLLILTEISKNYVGSALSDEFGDTIILEKRIFFKRQKDDEYSLQYPSDEFVDCNQNNNDSCFASEAFLNLLEVKSNGVFAYLSTAGRHSKTKCILFILKENKEAVLFSENDFLLLFLTKKQ